jgi:hypothetical protein
VQPPYPRHKTHGCDDLIGKIASMLSPQLTSEQCKTAFRRGTS